MACHLCHRRNARLIFGELKFHASCYQFWRWLKARR